MYLVIFQLVILALSSLLASGAVQYPQFEELPDVATQDTLSVQFFAAAMAAAGKEERSLVSSSTSFTARLHDTFG